MELEKVADSNASRSAEFATRVADGCCSVQFIKQNRDVIYKVIKGAGPPRPEISLTKEDETKAKKLKCHVAINVYNKASWLCGCDVLNALFCFPCLVFSGDTETSREWTVTGITTVLYLTRKVKRHESTASHMKCELLLTDINHKPAHQVLKSSYWKARQLSNEQITKNRSVLFQLINSIKFCDLFKETAPHGKTQIDIPGKIKIHIKYFLEENRRKIKALSPPSTQDELLDAFIIVYNNEIKKQVSEARFVALQCDELYRNSTKQVFVLMKIRYQQRAKIYERFWKILVLNGWTADEIAKQIRKELKVLNIAENQLVSQSYEGLRVLSDRALDIQRIVQGDFPLAFYVHSYAHQLQDTLLKSACGVKKNVTYFLANLQGISDFFLKSSERINVLNNVVKKWYSTRVKATWDFDAHAIRIVLENEKLLKECFETILDESLITDYETINQCQTLLGYLNNAEFHYWLKFFAELLIPFETLSRHFKPKEMASKDFDKCLANFEEAITNIGTLKETNQKISFSTIKREICDVLIQKTKERFQFLDHLTASKLLFTELFADYERKFPGADFHKVTKIYAFFDKDKLHHELSVIYAREDFQRVGTLAMLQLLEDRGLTKCFSETVTLIQLICTIPMPNVESGRCVLPVKLSKDFLNNIKLAELNQNNDSCLQLNAIFTLEKDLLMYMPDFSSRVVDAFTEFPTRKADFSYNNPDNN